VIDMAEIPIELTRGGRAWLVAVDGGRGKISSEVASAPGSRLEGQLDGGRSLKLKVHRCVKNEARFDIEGRFIDLTRELRLRLEEELQKDT
jgi:hypothetical protein